MIVMPCQLISKKDERFWCGVYDLKKKGGGGDSPFDHPSRSSVKKGFPYPLVIFMKISIKRVPYKNIFFKNTMV